MPGRWTQYDEPEYRTGGMRRVGYDADTRRYTFQDGGELYEGEPGVEMGGHMRHVGKAPPDPPPEAARQSNRYAWRQLLPFFLLIGVVMGLVYKFVISAGVPLPPGPPPVACPSGYTKYIVSTGDTCWGIASAHQWTVDELVAANKDVNCDKLQQGRELCVPGNR